MSPRKKRGKASDVIATFNNNLKRKNDSDGSPSKRSQTEKNPADTIKQIQMKKFRDACEQISFTAYLDNRARFLLIHLPSCVNSGSCNHHAKEYCQEMPPYAEEVFMIDVRSNMWFDALEVCTFSVTPTQYLSANILKEVVEIMMNVQRDEDLEITPWKIVMKCQQILMQNFSMHPPCLEKKRLRQCYSDFLTKPLDTREKTFTNRNQFGHDKGIVIYCLNRLEYEISSDSKDESLVDVYENTPQEMKEGLKAIAWKKEKCEIFEVLDRTERIDRLMAVLDSLIELLQFDLAIWNCRYTNNQGTHIMRSHKPLMANILWSKNILNTGAFNSTCRQIIKIFVYLVHLKYPDKHIVTMTLWLNAVVQTFYICENNSSKDYPNPGKYCSTFANEFYKIITDMPHDSILRILDNIKPTYMKYLIGTLHLKNLLSTKEACVIRNFKDFITESKWNQFPDIGPEVHMLQKELFPKPKSSPDDIVQCTIEKLSELALHETEKDVDSVCYPKLDDKLEQNKPKRHHVILTLCTTLESYIDAYSLSELQQMLSSCNEKVPLNSTEDVTINETLPQLNSYSVTEQFINRYLSICKSMNEVTLLLGELKNSAGIPDFLNSFNKIGIIDLT